MAKYKFMRNKFERGRRTKSKVKENMRMEVERSKLAEINKK